MAIRNKSFPEQGLGHGFQGGILPLQQIYFVVQAAEDGCDGFLFLNIWIVDSFFMYIISINSRNCTFVVILFPL